MEARSEPAEQFETMAQQQEASRLGLWAFLATEVLFFGGLFMAYIVYRHLYPHAFAIGSLHTNLLYGTINTAILLTSSLAMALAVNAAEEGRNKQLVRWLLVTLLFAAGFLVVKALEYTEDVQEHLFPGPHFQIPAEPRSELFFY